MLRWYIPVANIGKYNMLFYAHYQDYTTRVSGRLSRVSESRETDATITGHSRYVSNLNKTAFSWHPRGQCSLKQQHTQEHLKCRLHPTTHLRYQAHPSKHPRTQRCPSKKILRPQLYLSKYLRSQLYPSKYLRFQLHPSKILRPQPLLKLLTRNTDLVTLSQPVTETGRKLQLLEHTRRLRLVSTHPPIAPPGEQLLRHRFNKCMCCLQAGLMVLQCQWSLSGQLERLLCVHS